MRMSCFDWSARVAKSSVDSCLQGGSIQIGMRGGGGAKAGVSNAAVCARKF